MCLNPISKIIILSIFNKLVSSLFLQDYSSNVVATLQLSNSSQIKAILFVFFLSPIYFTVEFVHFTFMLIFYKNLNLKMQWISLTRTRIISSGNYQNAIMHFATNSVNVNPIHYYADPYHHISKLLLSILVYTLSPNDSCHFSQIKYIHTKSFLLSKQFQSLIQLKL